MGDALLRRRRHSARHLDHPVADWPELDPALPAPGSPRAHGTRLRDLRREAGFATSNQLAAALQQAGLRATGGTVSRWERGLTRPTPEEADVLAFVLGQELQPDPEGPAPANRAEEVVDLADEPHPGPALAVEPESEPRPDEALVAPDDEVAEVRAELAQRLAEVREEHAREVAELRRAHQALVDELLVEASRSAHELRTAQQEALAEARAELDAVRTASRDGLDAVLAELADATERAVRCREEAEAAATEAAAVLAAVREDLARAQDEVDGLRARATRPLAPGHRVLRRATLVD